MFFYCCCGCCFLQPFRNLDSWNPCFSHGPQWFKTLCMTYSHRIRTFYGSSVVLVLTVTLKIPKVEDLPLPLRDLLHHFWGSMTFGEKKVLPMELCGPPVSLLRDHSEIRAPHTLHHSLSIQFDTTLLHTIVGICQPQFLDWCKSLKGSDVLMHVIIFSVNQALKGLWWLFKSRLGLESGLMVIFLMFYVNFLWTWFDSNMTRPGLGLQRDGHSNAFQSPRQKKRLRDIKSFFPFNVT